MFVTCVHPVAVVNAEFCMTCSLLMLVGGTRGDHMEEAYSIPGLMTDLYVAMSISFCLPHPVAVSALIICSGLCACYCDVVNGCAVRENEALSKRKYFELM